MRYNGSASRHRDVMGNSRRGFLFSFNPATTTTAGATSPMTRPATARTLAIAVLCVGLSATACSGGSTDHSSPAGAGGGQAKRSAPALRTIRGHKTGFSFEVPRGWKWVDETNDGADVFTFLRQQQDLLGSTTVDHLEQTIKEQNVAYAVDANSQNPTGSTNIGGYCVSSPPASIGAVKATVKEQLAAMHATDTHISDVKVDGHSALRVAYVHVIKTPKVTETAAGTQYRIQVGGRLCYLVTARRNGAEDPFRDTAKTIKFR